MTGAELANACGLEPASSRRMHTGLRRRLETVFVIAGLMLFSGVFDRLFMLVGSGRLQTYVQLAVFGGIVLLISIDAGKFLAVVMRDKLLLILIIYAVCSVLWSVAPDVSSKRIGVFAGAAVFAYFIAARFNINQQYQMYYWALGLAVVMSAAAALLMPDFGIMKIAGGGWQGVLDHKNALGRIASLGFIMSVLRAVHKSSKARRWIAPLFFITVVVLSKSAMSVLACMAFVFILPFLVALRARDRNLLPVVLSALLLLAYVVLLAMWFNQPFILELLGKNPTQNSLYGRVSLWQTVLDKIMEKPWLGYGYNGFWLGWDGASADILLAHGWGPNHAHNGYLDLWLELGLIGFSIVIVHIGISLLRNMAYARHTSSAAGLWPLAYLGFLMTTNLAYSLLFSKAVFFMALYIATNVRVLVEQRQWLATRRPVSPPQMRAEAAPQFYDALP